MPGTVPDNEQWTSLAQPRPEKVTAQEVWSARLIRLANDQDGKPTSADVVALSELDPEALPGPTSALAEFVLARLAEDEAGAQAAAAGTAGHWYSSNSGIGLKGSSFLLVQDDGIHSRYGHHIARWDPARVLAECAAKRSAVELCLVGAGAGVTVLSAFARVHADHPDFDPAWAVQA